MAGLIRGLNPNDWAEVIKFKAAVQLMQAYTTDQQAFVDAVFRVDDSTTGVGSFCMKQLIKGSRIRYLGRRVARQSLPSAMVIRQNPLP